MGEGEIEHFILEEQAQPPALLANHLTAPASNVILAYISAYTEGGSTVLDPFAQTDVVAREALKMGRKAVLSDFNPISAFATRTLHSSITEQQMTYGLVRLGEGIKVETSLREHLNELYASTCSLCQRPVSVSHFVWSRDDKKPITKFFYCPCRQPSDGTRRIASEPASEQDVELSRRVEPRGFHYWFVLDRLAPPSGTQLALAKQALDMYTSRNLYAMVTILLQIESGFENPQQRDFLKLALLDCFDRCSKVNANGGRRNSATESNRLRVPSQFLERNVWEAFEDATKSLEKEILERRREGYTARLANHAEQLVWRGPTQPLPQMPNLFVTQQMARFLTNELPESSVDLVITEPPRAERMEYLALSYLWTGWLFGSEQTQIFEHVHTTHPKADWAAYYKASVFSLRALGHVVREDGTILLRFASQDLSKCLALLCAGIAAGLKLRRLLYRPADVEAANGRAGKKGDDYILEFRRQSHSPSSRRPSTTSGSSPSTEVPRVRSKQNLEHALATATMHATKGLLSRRAEPTRHRVLALAIYEHLAAEGLLADALGLLKEEEDVFAAVRELTRETMRRVLQDHFVRLSPESDRLHDTIWWLPRRPVGVVPLSDQIETAVYNILSTSKGTSKENVVQTILGLYPGLLTPDRGWIEDCVDSYARQDGSQNLILRSEDSLKARTQEHNQMVAMLAQLGHEFGFKVWIGRPQQKAEWKGMQLGSLLSDAERNFGPESLLGGPNAPQTDVVWYDLGKYIHVFEVEWTTVFTEAIMARNQSTQSIRRLLVVPEERVPLIRAKLARYPWLGQAVEETPWEFIKFQRLTAFAATETERNAFSLNKIVGLNPPVEQETAQLRLL